MSSCLVFPVFFFFQLREVSSLPGLRELVRLRPGEGDQHLALVHWVLSSKSFAVKTLQKEEVVAKHLNFPLVLFTSYIMVHIIVSRHIQNRLLLNKNSPTKKR